MRNEPGRVARDVVVPAFLFVLTFFSFAFLFLAAPSLPDADSYFHLAVAREYGAGGYMEALPWTRLSVLGEGYGDKELLFHGLLVPFASWMDAAVGGRLALAALNAFFAAIVARFAIMAIGTWGVCVPLILYATAPMFVGRIVRLRPELLALILLVVFIRVSSQRRYGRVALVSFLFALSYTAFHVVAGLAVLFLFIDRDWKRLGATLGGIAGGLLIHPGFPANLKIWWIQNVEFFLRKSQLDVGVEIGPPSPFYVFVRNAGFWIVLLAIWLLHQRRGDPRPSSRLFQFSFVALAAFTILFVMMGRMAIYFVAFAVLTTVYALEGRPWRPLASSIALIVAMVLALPENIRLLGLLLTDTGTVRTWESDFEAFGKAVPAGATIAATWGTSEYYTFWAPQGRYLNVLDPIFMAYAYPAEYEIQRSLFEGIEPDAPVIVRKVLRSDYIAVDATQAPVLRARLEMDPRVERLYDGYNFLGQIVPAPGRFVLDWRLESGALLPKSGDPGYDGYVDMRYEKGHRCVRATRSETVPTPEQRRYEFAPYGPAALSVDGRQLAVMPRSSGAILGRGARISVDLAAGEHVFTVDSCRSDSGHNGFYLVRR